MKGEVLTVKLLNKMKKKFKGFGKWRKTIFILPNGKEATYDNAVRFIGKNKNAK